MAIDWAAETVYWIERAKVYAEEAGVPQDEIDSMERCKETPRKEANGPSVMEGALGMSLENLSEQELEESHKRVNSLMAAFLATGAGEELKPCCNNPKCPVRADIIMHNQQLKAEMN